MIDEALPAVKTAGSSRREIARAITLAIVLYVVYALAIAALNRFAPALPPLMWAVIGITSTAAYLFIVLMAIRILARLSLSLRMEWMLAILSLLAYFAINPMVRQAGALLMKGVGFWEIFSALTSPEMSPLLHAVLSFCFIFTSTFFGRLLSRIIRERALLMPVGLVASLIDFWGVYWGPVNFMSESSPVAVSGIGSATSVAASIPPAAINKLSAPLAVLAQIAPPETIGLGDFVFIAFFIACAYRLGFSAVRTFWGVFVGMLLASIVMGLDGSQLFGMDIEITYLPGLVFICGGVLLANLGSWRLSHHEWAMTALPVVLIGSLISYSIVRTEMDKPRIKTFIITADNPHAAIEEGLSRVSGNRAPIIIQASFGYMVKGKSAHLQQASAAALQRQPKITELNTREFLCVTTPQKEKHRWRITIRCSNHPERTLPLLKWLLPDVKGGSVALIRHAQPVPASAYAVLNTADELAVGTPTGQRSFQIILISKEGMVVSEQGKLIKALPYKKTAGSTK